MRFRMLEKAQRESNKGTLDWFDMLLSVFNWNKQVARGIWDSGRFGKMPENVGKSRELLRWGGGGGSSPQKT